MQYTRLTQSDEYVEARERRQPVVRVQERACIRKLGQRWQLAPDVVDVGAQLASRLAQPRHVVFGEARRILRPDAQRIGNPLVLPGVVDHLLRRRAPDLQSRFNVTAEVYPGPPALLR